MSGSSSNTASNTASNTGGANPVALTSADYQLALFDVLPRGKAWNRAGPFFSAFWGAVADFLMRFHAAAVNLLAFESFPGTAVQLLPDWETALGLPDPCVTDPLTIGQRQMAAAAKMAGTFDPTAANFITFAAQLGYAITITYPAPNTWVVTAPTVTIDYFRAGIGVAGQALESVGDTLLECAIKERAPAHTMVEFVFA